MFSGTTIDLAVYLVIALVAGCAICLSVKRDTMYALYGVTVVGLGVGTVLSAVVDMVRYIA